MKVNNLELLIKEIRKIGETLINNKRNIEWLEIIDFEKNTSIADHEIDKLLRSSLVEFGVDAPYFSEEVPHSIEDRPNEYWLADPIDGTASWLGGYIGYVIQAAYIKNNKPVFAFIYWPEKKYFYHSFKGKGIFLNNKLVLANNNKKLVIVDNYPEARGFVGHLMKKFPNLNYLEMGSLGLKSLLVALGECDLFIKTTRYRDWDIFPAKLFIDESGFELTSLCEFPLKLGNQIEFNEGLLVYNPLTINESMISYIKNGNSF
jgi:3'(2'), 5'-bisphosphate nucleotidase